MNVNMKIGRFLLQKKLANKKNFYIKKVLFFNQILITI